MLCGVLYTHVKAGGAAPSQRMERADVLRELHFISRLLSNEFVYAPEGLVANAEKTIQALEMDDVILCEGQLLGLSPKERAAGRNNFDFFCFLIWPFIETCTFRPPRLPSRACELTSLDPPALSTQTGSPPFRSLPSHRSHRLRQRTSP